MTRHRVLILFSLLSILSSTSADCLMDIKQLPAKIPLFLDLTPNIIYPDYGGSVVKIKQNDQIELACPGGKGLRVGGVSQGINAKATCLSKYQFQINGITADLTKDVICACIKTIARYTTKTCSGNGKEIEVGFELSNNRFLQQYTSCFDDTLRNVIYVHHILSKYIGARVPERSVASWSEYGTEIQDGCDEPRRASFYNLSPKINSIYYKTTERSTINKQLNIQDGDITYVNPNSEFYLAKGHHAAQGDFVYNAQQMATYYYINSSPQWQKVNNARWKSVENRLRTYASNNFVDLDIYTGSYNILKLSSKATAVFLHYTNQNAKFIPIPEQFWKFVYDQKNQAGVVVLGVNNPHLTDSEKNKIEICDGIDIKTNLKWLYIDDQEDLSKGYIYACTVDDFRKVYHDFPDFGQLNLLQ